MKRNSNLLVLFFIFLFNGVVAQSSPDTVFVSLDQMVESVKAFHPVIQKISLTRPAFKARVMEARGQFDPVWMSEHHQKNFKGRNYYYKWYHQLKVPTSLGINFQADIENNNGTFLNNEEITGGNPLLYLGAQLPVGRSLIFNERRWMLRAARILEKASESVQNQFMNDFLEELGHDYAAWLFAFQKMKLYAQAYELARDRYNFMLQRITWGDEAPIDSVEMSIQLQFLAVRLSEAKADYLVKKNKMNTYLWNSQPAPLELADNMYPMNQFIRIRLFHDSIYRTDTRQLVDIHPEILWGKAELQTRELALQYAKFRLLPDFYMGYYAINELKQPLPAWDFSSNYKWNGYFYFPLFLRKERAHIRLSSIRQKEREYDLMQKFRELEQKIGALRGVYQQLILQNQNIKLAVNNSVILRDAEKTKFNNGESSVFLINARENNLLDMSVRFFENEMRIQQYYFDFLKSSGKLYQFIMLKP